MPKFLIINPTNSVLEFTCGAETYKLHGGKNDLQPKAGLTQFDLAMAAMTQHAAKKVTYEEVPDEV